MDNFLSQTEQEIADRIARDEKGIIVLKKIFLRGLYENGTLKPDKDPVPTRNFALGRIVDAIGKSEKIDKEKLGEDLWVAAMGMYLMLDGFNQLEKLKKVQPVKESEKPKYR